MPQVSVVVPIYQVEAWLPRCLESIAAQTFRDFECILVDDGSPDGCGALCDEWSSRDARFSVIHKPNGGVSSARNAGLAAAKAPWLIFCDSDDFLHPQLLEQVLELQAEAAPGTFVLWKLGPAGSVLPLPKPEVSQCTAAQVFGNGDFSSVCSKLWNRQLLTSFSLKFNETLPWAEDADFVSRYLLAFAKSGRQITFLVIAHTLYFYNSKRIGNTTSSYFPAKLSCEYQLLPQLLELFQTICGTDPVLLAPFCRHELFVLLGRLSDCVRFETELSPRARREKARACLELPCMQNFLVLCQSCRVWPAMTFCARHGLMRLCVFFSTNCYKPWYIKTIRAWLWIKNKFYWGGQAIRRLLPKRKAEP